MTAAVKVIDCLLSLNVVLPRVQQFARNHTKITELSHHPKLIISYESPVGFNKAEFNYIDKMRTQKLVRVID